MRVTIMISLLFLGLEPRLHGAQLLLQRHRYGLSAGCECRV